MKLCRRCNCEKQVTDFGPNSARSNGLQVYCRPCMAAYRKSKSYDKERWASHKEVESQRNKDFRTRNADTLKPHDRQRAAARRAANPGVIRASNIARKHGEKRATPAWADMAKINAIYLRARSMELADGVKRHVDHNIPLKSALVCGLHVHTNLSILTATANMQKHNRYEMNA